MYHDIRTLECFYIPPSKTHCIAWPSKCIRPDSVGIFMRRGWGNAVTGILNYTIFNLQSLCLLCGHEECTPGSSQALAKDKWDLGRTRDKGWKKLTLGIEEPEKKLQWGNGFLKTRCEILGQSVQHRHNRISIMKRVMRTLHIKASILSNSVKPRY